MQNVALKEKINKPYDLNDPIIHFYKQINECLKMAEDADSINFTAGKVLNQALYNLQETGIYKYKVKEWNKKAIADKTWKI